MANSSDSPLQRAVSLIKAGDKKSASRLLKQILQNDKGNAGAWWLLANAVDNPKHQEKALEEVLKLRPAEKRAQQMLTRIRMGDSVASSSLLGRDATPIAPLDRPASRPAPYSRPSSTANPFEDDNPFVDDPFDDDPFADDPFTDNPFTDDPFSSPKRSARPNMRRDNPFDDPFESDDPFASDDPFGGKNPFGPDAASMPRLHQPSGVVRTQPSPKSGGNTFIIAGVIAAVIVIIAAVAIMVFSMTNSTSTMPISGNCDIGAQSHPQQAIISCFETTLDSRWTGHLNVHEQHNWTFNASAGQVVTFYVQTRTTDRTDAGYTDTVLELVSPDNVVLAINDDIETNENFNSRITTTLDKDGIYTLRIRDYSDNGGDYDLRVTAGTNNSEQVSSNSTHCDVGIIDRSWRQNATRIACSSIERGSLVTGRINGNEEHAWTFQGRGGESYTITLDGTDNGDMYLELYNQSGVLIAENDDYGDSINSRLTVTLTGSEQYTIVASTYLHFTTEPYELRLNG